MGLCWQSTGWASAARRARCLQPCLSMCPAKMPPSCSGQEGLWIFGCWWDVHSLNSMDLWVAQGTRMSSLLGVQLQLHYVIRIPWGVLQHTPSPRHSGEDGCTASPGNTWNTCRPHVLPHYGLSKHSQWPSLPPLPPHFWSCLTLAGQRFGPVLPFQGKHVFSFSWAMQGFGFGLKLCLAGPFLQFWSGFSFPRTCSPVQA